MKSKKIPRQHKEAFTLLQKALPLGQVAIMRGKERATGKPATLLCLANRTEDGGAIFIPIAHMSDGDMFELFEPDK